MGTTSTQAVSGHAPASAPRGSGLTIDHVWALLPILVPVLVSLISQMVAIDLAYHVRAGELLLNTRHIPSIDTFTFSVAGKPWFDQQWGAQGLLALAFRAGGWATVSFARALLIGTTFMFVYLSCRARGARPAQASALSLAGFVVSLQALAMRPQLFAITLFAASVWAISTRGENPWRVWLVPVFTVFWANLHGSFVLGPLLIGLAWIEALLDGKRSEARHLVPVGIATVLATCLTPFGPFVWRYAYQLAANPVVRNDVSEWAPVTIRSFGGAAFFASGLAVAVYFARHEGRANWPDLVWLTAFFVLALPAVRGIVWWSLIAPVIVAAYVPANDPDGEDPAARQGTPLLNRLVVAVLVAGILLALPWWRPGPSTALLSQAPVGLSEAAGKALPPGTRLFVSEPWGSWFEHALPSIPVFVDPRIEIFPAGVWDDYTEIRAGGSRWQAIFDRWGIRAVVADREDFPQLLSVMQASKQWTAIYQDHDGVLFVRSDAAAAKQSG